MFLILEQSSWKWSSPSRDSCHKQRYHKHQRNQLQRVIVFVISDHMECHWIFWIVYWSSKPKTTQKTKSDKSSKQDANKKTSRWPKTLWSSWQKSVQKQPSVTLSNSSQPAPYWPPREKPPKSICPTSEEPTHCSWTSRDPATTSKTIKSNICSVRSKSSPGKEWTSNEPFGLVLYKWLLLLFEHKFTFIDTKLSLKNIFVRRSMNGSN